jgi:uncharacterized iron-regulated protein
MKPRYLLVLMLLGCSPKRTEPAAAPAPPGESIVIRGKSAGPDDVVALARGARFVFLGELHDNPRHHALQAEILAALVAGGREPAVVFEMLDVDQTPIVMQQRDPATFGEAVGWEKRGWPSYTMYEPLVRVAMTRHLPIVAGNLGRQALMAASKKGETPASFGFTAALDAAELSVIEDNVRKGHCGYADDAAVKVLASAQVLRDAHLAQRLLASATRDGAVLVAGGEHANRSHGAAFHAAHAPGMSPDHVLAIGFVEPGAAAAGYDVVWTTAPIERPDPCVAFKEKLERLR